MNNIFKTKYDITTGQCKAVSELVNTASNGEQFGGKARQRCFSAVC